jgi:hypothetical protein
MAKLKPIIPLANRLESHAQKARRQGHTELASDLYAAAAYCRRFAFKVIIEEALAESDPKRRFKLIEQAAAAALEARHGQVRS